MRTSLLDVLPGTAEHSNQFGKPRNPTFGKAGHVGNCLHRSPFIPVSVWLSSSKMRQDQSILCVTCGQWKSGVCECLS